MEKSMVKFIDIFAGLGGIRLGFEAAFQKRGFETECVLTSEIKPTAIQALNHNFKHNKLVGDITKVSSEEIPNFDFLLAGFPCQAFSVAGKQRGFMDTRGTLFFEIERILKDKQPFGFLLENVEGLVTHDRENPLDQVGRTLKTIIKSLTDLGYNVNYRVLNAQYFGVPQSRNRIYIVGTKTGEFPFGNFETKTAVFKDVMERGLPTIDSAFTKKLLEKYTPAELYGKSIKDKRGGMENIHSWDIEIRGKVTRTQKMLLNNIMTERRKKKWASIIGIDWMDGMPLTCKQIAEFFPGKNLQSMLDDLTKKGYLSYEHPKKKVKKHSDNGKHVSYERVTDESKPKGYNIVTGKLSFDFSKFLNPNDITHTLVAMDMSTVGVVEGEGVRNLTLGEGLKLFGYPEPYSLDFFTMSKRDKTKAFDLLGNSVCVPVIQSVSDKLATIYEESIKGVLR